jgi:hypothetical protein
MVRSCSTTNALIQALQGGGTDQTFISRLSFEIAMPSARDAFSPLQRSQASNSDVCLRYAQSVYDGDGRRVTLALVLLWHRAD